MPKLLKYVGVNDHEIDLFESQFKVPNGMSYNSYVILDKKIAVMDSVDENFGEEWLENIRNVLKNDADGQENRRGRDRRDRRIQGLRSGEPTEEARRAGARGAHGARLSVRAAAFL